MNIDLIVVRDPDAATEVHMYIDGISCGPTSWAGVELNEVHLDPGAGWTRADWNERRDEAVESVHPDVADAVGALYDELGNSPYVEQEER